MMSSGRRQRSHQRRAASWVVSEPIHAACAPAAIVGPAVVASSTTSSARRTERRNGPTAAWSVAAPSTAAMAIIGTE